MVDVWRGSVLTLDGSLQLLLLIDYIFDRARDNYRFDIIRLLRGLANGDNDAASNIYADTDIYSTLRENTVFVLNEERERQAYMDRLLIKKQFARLDTNRCAIRHAALSETHYRCLYLTEDTYDLFLRSCTTSQADAVNLRKRLYEQVTHPVLVHARTLEALEQELTGNCRLSGSRDSLFYISLSFSTSLSPDWDIIREFHVLAFAQSLRGKFYPECATLGTETRDELVLNFVQSLQASSMACQLEAAISRRRFVLRGLFPASSPLDTPGVSDRIGTEQQKMGSEAEFERGERRCRYCDRELYRVPHLCRLNFTKEYNIRDQVQNVYRLCKRDSIEPEEPFLRISESLSQLQHTGLDTKSPTIPHPDKLKASEDGYVLIWSFPSDDATQIKNEICVYIVAENTVVPDRSERMGKARRSFETVDMYHTIRDFLNSAWSGDWNLINTYGITTHCFIFYTFLCEGDWMEYCPVTLGSDRARHRTGSYIWQRNLSPGRKYPRGNYVFLHFQVLLQELCFWFDKAAEKRRVGIDCCTLCGEEGVGQGPGKLITSQSCATSATTSAIRR